MHVRRRGRPALRDGLRALTQARVTVACLPVVLQRCVLGLALWSCSATPSEAIDASTRNEWHAEPSEKRISERWLQLERVKGSTLLGLLILRKWTPDGVSRAELTKGFLSRYEQLCGRALEPATHLGIDLRYRARFLRRPTDFGCRSMYSPDYETLSPECSRRTDPEAGRGLDEQLRAALVARLEASSPRDRVARTKDVVRLARSACGYTDLPQWCVDEIWDPSSLLGGEKGDDACVAWDFP